MQPSKGWVPPAQLVCQLLLRKNARSTAMDRDPEAWRSATAIDLKSRWSVRSLSDLVRFVIAQACLYDPAEQSHGAAVPMLLDDSALRAFGAAKNRGSYERSLEDGDDGRRQRRLSQARNSIGDAIRKGIRKFFSVCEARLFVRFGGQDLATLKQKHLRHLATILTSQNE
jgi:hypothetical protein